MSTRKPQDWPQAVNLVLKFARVSGPCTVERCRRAAAAVAVLLEQQADHPLDTRVERAGKSVAEVAINATAELLIQDQFDQLSPLAQQALLGGQIKAEAIAAQATLRCLFDLRPIAVAKWVASLGFEAVYAGVNHLDIKLDQNGVVATFNSPAKRETTWTGVFADSYEISKTAKIELAKMKIRRGALELSKRAKLPSP